MNFQCRGGNNFCIYVDSCHDDRSNKFLLGDVSFLAVQI